MEHKEKSDLIEKAIREAMIDSEDFEEGDILIDWVVIGYATNPDKEKESVYPMFMSNGDIPTYRVVGLLAVALKNLNELVDE